MNNYFYTHIFRLLNFDTNKMVLFGIKYFLIEDSTRPIGQTRWWPE